MLKLELQLSEQDVKYTLAALQEYVSEMSSEIADTNNQDFRDNLKHKRISIYKVIEQLKNYLPQITG